jgi:nicotinate-nucleotide--dimethylbenzimidazole phosphoribosyltransferase
MRRFKEEKVDIISIRSTYEKFYQGKPHDKNSGDNMKLPNIPAFDEGAANQATQRQQQLTKPAGALGQLETLSIRLAGMTGKARPRFTQKEVILMAADHGIALEGVSAYPMEVTAQMVMNILHDGAAINVLARQAGAKVTLVDIGVALDLDDCSNLIVRKLAYGSHNMLKGPAMTYAQAQQSIQVGLDIVNQRIDQGCDLVATGDMGIGNTTPSAAITALVTGLPVAQVTGRGTGIDDVGLLRKIEMIQKAIDLNKPDPTDPLDVLAKIGGYEIGGLAGVMLGAAARRVPVVVDGFISGAAALLANELDPRVTSYMIASHQSVEIGHKAIWQKLGLQPLFDLDMRLGEGTGAVLAFHLIEAAVRILDEMATFDEAGVSDKE